MFGLMFDADTKRRKSVKPQITAHVLSGCTIMFSSHEVNDVGGS